MESQSQRRLIFLLAFCFLFTLLIAGCEGVSGWSHSHGHHHHHQKRRDNNLKGGDDGPKKLFVFGDSYADTGNNAKSLANSWKDPYGITFPGKPAGRFSDGRVLTDYFASSVGIKSPIPYRWRRFGGKRVRLGLNFAYGGTGVFETLVPGPNMTTQIGFLEKLVKDSVFMASDLRSAVALVTLSGNDYSAALAKNASTPGLLAFIPRVVDQLALNLKRIHGLGIQKVAVTALQPLGCLPRSTIASSFRSCNATENTAVRMHNLLLQRAVAKLNVEAKSSSSFVLLDLFGAFMSVFNNEGNVTLLGKESEFEKPLEPCCVGRSQEFACGSVDEGGTKMYSVCEQPESAFFWDSVHPTQQGWKAVYSALQPHLQHFWN